MSDKHLSIAMDASSSLLTKSTVPIAPGGAQPGAQPTSSTSPSSPRRRWLIGVALLLFVVCLWVSSSTAIQFILRTQDFTRPFFLTYFSTSMFRSASFLLLSRPPSLLPHLVRLLKLVMRYYINTYFLMLLLYRYCFVVFCL